MKRKIFYGWWVVIACSVITVYVAGAVFSGFTAFFNPIRETFGWSYTQISFATSLRGLEMGLFSPFVGFLVDRYGAKKLILLGNITIGVGFLLLSQTQTLFMFYGSFLLISFGAGGCAAVVLTTVVVNWFRNKVGIALALMGSGAGIGGLLVPLIVRLIELYQWRITLIILGLGMWVIGIPLSLIIRNRPEPYGYLPDGGPADGGVRESNTSFVERHMSFRDSFKSKSFKYLTVAEMMRFAVISAVSVHVMPYLRSIEVSRRFAGIIAGAIPFFSIFGRFGFGWLGDRYNKRNVMIWAFITMSLGTFTFCYLNIHGLFIPFLLLFAPGLGGSMVLRSAFLREYFGRDSFGKLIGLLMGAGSIGGVLGPLIAGWTFDTWGSYSYVWLAYFGIMILSTCLILRIK